MKLIETHTGIIWSAWYEGESVDVFARLFRQWIDTEYLTNYITENQRFLAGNPFFSGLSVKDVIMNANKEARAFRLAFNKYYWNGRNGTHPDLDDRFIVLNRRAGIDDLKREMYGHPPDLKLMTSVFRLYAVKVPSEKQNEPAAYIVTGGGIKLTDAMPQMKELQKEYNRIELVQNWLHQNKITTKEQLIAHQNKYAEQHNDKMGAVGEAD